MQLVYLTPNQTWCFLLGDTLVRLDREPMFFSRRDDAVAAARDHGLFVDDTGAVSEI